MNDRVGLVSFPPRQEAFAEKPYSDETAQMIDGEVGAPHVLNVMSARLAGLVACCVLECGGRHARRGSRHGGAVVVKLARMPAAGSFALASPTPRQCLPLPRIPPGARLCA